eukprot:124594-Chlamydomonas_euryale.AAC.6
MDTAGVEEGRTRPPATPHNFSAKHVASAEKRHVQGVNGMHHPWNAQKMRCAPDVCPILPQCMVIQAAPGRSTALLGPRLKMPAGERAAPQSRRRWLRGSSDMRRKNQATSVPLCKSRQIVL